MAENRTAKILILGLKWLVDDEEHDESDYIACRLAKALGEHPQAEVYFTVPVFQKDLERKYSRHNTDAKQKRVTLVGARCLPGRHKTPQSDWISDNLEQHYSSAINPLDGYLQVRFTHVVGFVPSTYRSAIDFVETYRDDTDSVEPMKVVLVVCDIDAQRLCVTDEKIKSADHVFVMGGASGSLNYIFNAVNAKFSEFMLAPYYTYETELQTDSNRWSSIIKLGLCSIKR